MEKEKIKKLALKFTADKENPISSFRKNIYMLIAEKDITLREVSELSDIPYSTLNTFLYGDATDCKLSTAVKLARVFGVSIDEIVGAETIEFDTRECVALSRCLPEHARSVCRAYITHLYKMYAEIPNTSRAIPVMLPKCVNGYLPTTNIVRTISIDHLTDNLKSKVCLGLQIPCSHYEPYYFQNEIILLSADRPAMNNEECLVTYKGNYFICIKKIDIHDGKKVHMYASLVDGKTIILPDEIDDKIGYIVGFLNTDGSWGRR